MFWIQHLMLIFGLIVYFKFFFFLQKLNIKNNYKITIFFNFKVELFFEEMSSI